MPDQPEGIPAAVPAHPRVRLDDANEDRARDATSVAEVVAEDLASDHTPSRQLPDGDVAGFDVPTEPLDLDDGGR
jgi:hypothetical protein